MPRGGTALAPLLGALAACGGDAPGVEAQIRHELARQVGVTVERVRCPDGPYPKRCVAEVGPTRLDVIVVEVDDALAWRLDGLVIATAPLEVRLAAELDDLGVDGAADCGPEILVVHVGDRLRCALDLPGGPGAAFVTILDEQIGLDIELALDPAAVEARTADVDDAELERRSRALDTGAPGDDDAAANGDGP